jgi:hypothetical protein
MSSNIVMPNLSNDSSEFILFKLFLVILFTQFGKTFYAINYIKDQLIKDKDEETRSIHIVFTMNTLLNSEQFASRLKTIEEEYGKGSICIFNSKSHATYRHAKNLAELQGYCFSKETCPRVIVMCSNEQRYDDVLSFLRNIDNNKNDNKGYITKAFVYYDEIHKFIDSKRKHIEDIHSLNIVECIIGLTATPEKILTDDGPWSNIKKMNAIVDKDIIDEYYAGVNDMDWQCVDDFFDKNYIRPRWNDYKTLSNHTVGFVKHVINNNSDILRPRMHVFIPGHISVQSHNEIRDFIFEKCPTAVVILLNGKEKSMKWYTKKTGKLIYISLKSENNEEICDTISREIEKYGLDERTLVITGHVCISMGQTLTNKELGSFNYAIFGFGAKVLDNDDTYQLFGRLTGRIKSWSTYINTTIFCTSEFKNICITMEKLARECILDEKNNITRESYLAPMYENPEGKDAIENQRIRKNKVEKEEKEEPNIIIRNSFEEIKDWIEKIHIPKLKETNQEEFKNKRGPNKRKPHDDGFFYAKIRTQELILTCSHCYKERRCNINNGAGWNLRPCYRKVDDKNSLEWWFIFYGEKYYDEESEQRLKEFR